MPKKKPSVALLHYSCPPVIGGVEFIIEAHAKLFAEAGYESRLIVGSGGKVHPKVRTVIVPEIASDGGPVKDVVSALGKGEVPAGFNKAVKRTEAKLKKALQGVDVCMMHNVLTMHFNLVLTAALANIMAKQKKIHFIGWNHDSTFADPNYKTHQRKAYPWSLLKKELPGCDYCVISAQRQKEFSRLFKVPRGRLPVISDGINVPELMGLTPEIAGLFRSEKLYGRDIVALTPTRIVRRKNLEAGIEIVAAMKKQGKDVRWMITGAPDPHNADAMEYYKKLTTLRRKLKVQKEVIFLCEALEGRISNESLRALFAVSDMLIFPSLREGFGIPALEGGTHELVLVLSNIPALKEIAGNDAVYIKPGVKPAVVARQAIAAFNKNAQLKFRKKVVSGYSWDAVFGDKIIPAVVSPKRVWKGKHS